MASGIAVVTIATGISSVTIAIVLVLAANMRRARVEATVATRVVVFAQRHAVIDAGRECAVVEAVVTPRLAVTVSPGNAEGTGEAIHNGAGQVAA